MISVIIPAYNAEKYIREAIDSVLNQTYQDFEIVVINDCSDDQTILRIPDDPRIKQIHSLFHRGVGASRNKGITYSKGEDIFFLDADDYITSKALETLYSGSEFYDIVEGLSFRFNDGIFDKDYYKDYKTHCWGKLYKRSFLNENKLRFDEQITCGEDTDFYLRCSKKAKYVAVIQKPIYGFRQHDKSTSRAKISAETFIYDFSRLRDVIQDDYQVANLMISHLIRTHYSDSDEIQKVIESDLMKECMKVYKPRPDQSKIIPFLINNEWVGLLKYFCKRRAAQ